jgi:hypothetical protein
VGMRARFDLGRWWLAVAIGVAALVAGGLYVALGDSEGPSDKTDKAVQAEAPPANDGGATAAGGGEPSPGGRKAGGNERQDTPAKPSSTRGGQPKEGKSSESGTVSVAEQTPPSEQSSVRNANRPKTGQPRLRKPNRPKPDQPPVRKPNRYGGQPSPEASGRGG